MPFNHSASLMTPWYLPLGSGWQDHIPFAFARVEMLKPRVIVELGTREGDSYMAFCQAIEMLGLSTQCYAVGASQDHRRAEFHGPDFFNELRTYHDPLYGRFSRLIQSNYESASRSFADDSVDLLHINAVHGYDEVKHAFEIWRQKMTSHSVILFHNTNLREGGSEVWKFWDEVKAHYPSFEFNYGDGLGIIGYGREVCPQIGQIFGLSQHEARNINAFFYCLGQRVRLAAMKDHLENRTSELERILGALGPIRPLVQLFVWFRLALIGLRRRIKRPLYRALRLGWH